MKGNKAVYGIAAAVLIASLMLTSGLSAFAAGELPDSGDPDGGIPFIRTAAAIWLIIMGAALAAVLVIAAVEKLRNRNAAAKEKNDDETE